MGVPRLQTVDVVMDETYLMRSPLNYKLSDFVKNTGLTSDEAASIGFLNPDSPNVWSVYGQFRAGNPPSTGTTPGQPGPLPLSEACLVRGAQARQRGVTFLYFLVLSSTF